MIRVPKTLRGQIRSLGHKRYSTKPNPPTAQQKKIAAPDPGGVPVIIATMTLFSGLLAASYIAETNPSVDEKIGSMQGVPTVLYPFRRIVVNSGLAGVPKSSQKIADAPSTEEAVQDADVTAVKDTLVADLPPAGIPEQVEADVDEGSGDDNAAGTAGLVAVVVDGDVDGHGDDTAPVEVVDAFVEEAEAEEKENKHAETENENVHLSEQTQKPKQITPVDTTLHLAEEAPALPAITSNNVVIPVLPSEETASKVDSSVLKQALADSAREYIALRRELELTLLKDIHTLDENELRLRIKQIATDMFERLAWEDMKLSQSLKGVEAELTQKYTDLMVKQRAELEFEIKKILFNFEKEYATREATQRDELQRQYQQQFNDAIRAQAEGFQATLKQELDEHGTKIQNKLQDQLNHEVAVLRQGQVDHLMQLEPRIQEVAAEIAAVEGIIDAAAETVKSTLDSHALSAAVLSLELALSSSGSYASGAIINAPEASGIAARFKALKDASGDDPLITSVIASLPDSVLSSGALDVPDLQIRFNVMRSEVRKAALAPEAAPKMVGQLIGSALAAVSFAPHGLVPGPGAEETMARAAYYLERGNLQRAVSELDGVTGYAQVLMTDWKRLARDRLVVDQTIKTLKAHSMLRHQSFLMPA